MILLIIITVIIYIIIIIIVLSSQYVKVPAYRPHAAEAAALAHWHALALHRHDGVALSVV